MAGRRSADLSSEILECNRQAMDRLKAGAFEAALSLLKQAESLLHDSPLLWKLQAITYNNLGCFYKKTRDLTSALSYLQLALDVEQHHPEDYTNIAGTHLNLCAVYSQGGRHKQALRQAQRALQVLKAHFQRSPNLVTTMAIAYHNIGVEFEYLRLRKPAGEAYYDGWDFAKTELGVSHPLTSSLRRSYQSCVDQRPLLEAPSTLPPLEFTPPKTKGIVSARVSPLFHQPWEGLPLVSFHSEEKKQKKNRSFEEVQGSYAFPKSSSPALEARFISGDRKQPMFPLYASPPVKPKPSDRRLSSLSSKLGAFSQRSSSTQEQSFSTISEKASQVSAAKASTRTKAALVIQRFFRGFTARQKLRRLKDLKQRQKIEAAGEMARKALEEVQKLRAELQEARSPKKSALPPARRRPSPRALSIIAEESGAKIAATTIQSAVRMFLSRRRFMRKREAALKIQNWWKVASVRSLYRSIREAIIFIQACYRGFRVRKRLRRESNLFL